MKKPTGSARKSLWHADWSVGLLIVVAVLVTHQASGLFDGLERRFYDHASVLANRTPSDRLAVIAIDDSSIANLGRWPWPRDVHARMVDLLASGGVKSIGQTALFLEPQTDRGLAYIGEIRDLSQGAAADDPLNLRLREVIERAERALDTDAALATSLAKARNVALPMVFELGALQGNPDRGLPPFVSQMPGRASAQAFSMARAFQAPWPLLGQQAAIVGHLNQQKDPADGVVRSDPLMVDFAGQLVPSMSLALAAHSLNLGMADISLAEPGALRLGGLRIPLDAKGSVYPQFYGDQAGREPFPSDSFFDVYSGKIPATKYAGKIVLIGATAAGVGDQFATPVTPQMAPAHLLAHLTSSILSEHFFSRPEWALGAQAVALLAVALYLMVALPRLSGRVAAATTAILFVALGGAEYLLLTRHHLWMELVLPMAMLALGYLGLTTKRYLVTEAGKLKSDEESAETNRMMGLSLQGQGQLDLAFDRFLRVPLNDAVMDNLMNLAMDFERKRQFNKAEAVYQHMASHAPGYKDLQSRLKRAKNLSETVMLGGASSHPGGTMLLDAAGGIEKPMLGRYQVEKELGKGAMGVVYLGKDPKIGRVVAIKTMALSQEFEGDELEDARQRFFREAETAGRLQHQHIVTIFDAGEDHDLAYIAMEFLKGADLVAHTKAGHLLSQAQVLSIAARVADALAYAHGLNVVHRDIKPANIMYEAQSDSVKVTDFGIARVTDASRTKTGMVLGTPSFMSPEQIAGKKVDGQSDLYSLGVTVFQLLAGVLPFRGDSMAELMFKIANEEAPDIRTVRPDVPASVAAVLARSLSKRLDVRYATGTEMAKALREAVLMDRAKAAPQSAPAPLAAHVPLADMPVPAVVQDMEATQRMTHAPFSASSDKTQPYRAPAFANTVILDEDTLPLANPQPGKSPKNK